MSDPLSLAAAKYAAGNDIVFQIVGDSTGQGLQLTTTPDPSRGWVGRLGIDIGTSGNGNVHYHGATFIGINWTGYDIDEMLHTVSGAPTLTIYNGSMGGAMTSDLASWISANGLIPNTSPDIVFIECGFNDVINGFGSSIVSRMQTLVTAVRSRCPTAPIIINTENRCTGTWNTAGFLPFFSALSNYYVGQNLNTTPALIASTVASGVWIMDTQQAYTHTPLTDWMTTADSNGGLHPNTLGYQAQADWMAAFFVPPAPVITTTSLNAMVRGVAFTPQTIAATGTVDSWGLKPGDSLPAGLTLTGATLSGTPTSYGPYSFSIRASNSGGFDDQLFTGTIDPNAPVITTTSLGVVSRGVMFSLPLGHTGGAVSSWTILTDSGHVHVVPLGLDLDSATGVVSGMPIQYGGTYDFTVRATNPGGSYDQRFTGSVDINASPFAPANATRANIKLIGDFYKINQKARIGGAFRPVLPRN